MPKINTDKRRPLPGSARHAPAAERLLDGAMMLVRPIGEFIHVSAIYLGIAVLTTLALSLVLPSMRQQSQQLHEVVLTMFQAAGNPYGAADDGAIDLASIDWSGALGGGPAPGGADAPAGGAGPTTGQPAPAPGAAGKDGGDAPPAASAQAIAAVSDPVTSNFTHALDATVRGQDIPGITQAQAQALRSYLARKYKIANTVAGAMVRIAFAVGAKQDVDPQLLLAVIAIESRYNPFAESSVGAQGLMQVMTRVHQDKLSGPGAPQVAVFNPVVNITVGAQILSDCIRRRGSVPGGLACYVGATNPSDGSGYGARVLAEQRRIALASGLAPKRR